MLRLLRSVRRRLIGEKNLSGYILYALGEILLIVIGILIALWIDNRNEEGKEARLEHFYLEGLQEEFRVNLWKLDTLIALNRMALDTGTEILKRLPGAQNRTQEAELNRMLMVSVSQEINYNPNISVLGELLGSGRLQILTNPELRQKLTSWNSSLTSMKQQETNMESIRKQVIDVVAGSEGSILTVLDNVGIGRRFAPEDDPRQEHSNLPVLKSLEFENKMLIYLLTAESKDRYFYQPLRENIVRIREIIESDLKS